MSTRPSECGYCGLDHSSSDPCPRIMTIPEKYAAIVALLKDELGEWYDSVNGADFIQDVSSIIDAPEMVPPSPPVPAPADRPHVYTVTAVCRATVTETWRVRSSRALDDEEIRELFGGPVPDDIEIECLVEKTSDEEDRDVTEIARGDE